MAFGDIFRTGADSAQAIIALPQLLNDILIGGAVVAGVVVLIAGIGFAVGQVRAPPQIMLGAGLG